MNEAFINQVHCMDFEALCDALEPQSIDLIASDLPYGTTACKWDKRVDFGTLWRCVKRVLKPRGVFLTTASEPFASLLRVSNLDWYKYDWVWDKVIPGNIGIVKTNPLYIHENILIFSEGVNKYNPQLQPEKTTKVFGKNHAHTSIISGTYGADYQINVGYPKTIIQFMKPNNLTDGGLHPTQKPVALYEYLIRTYTQPSDVVLDPFAGSGTTGLAALKTGRHYILGDSDAGYVEAARLRLQNADPYQPTVQDGIEQLSLFSALGEA